MADKQLKRVLEGSSISVRQEGSDPETLYGYAAKWDEETVIMGWYREVIRRGAFKQSVAEDDVRALNQHDSRQVVARTGNGSLSLREDGVGLAFEMQPNPDATAGRDLLALVGRGDVDKMSFGFNPRADGEKRVEGEPDDKLPLYELLDVRLWEISPVTWPAYDGTSVSMRALALADSDRIARGRSMAIRERWQKQREFERRVGNSLGQTR